MGELRFKELKRLIRNRRLDDTRELDYSREARLMVEASVIEDLIGEIWSMLPDDLVVGELKMKLAKADILSMGHTASLQLYFRSDK